MKKIIAAPIDDCNDDSDDEFFNEFRKLTVGSKNTFRVISRRAISLERPSVSIEKSYSNDGLKIPEEYDRKGFRAIESERPSVPCNLEPKEPKISVLKSTPFGTFSSSSAKNSTTAFSPLTVGVSFSTPDLTTCSDGNTDGTDAKNQTKKRARRV